MDAQARKKAIYRAKLNASKQEKRIESPLVRYNEVDQPVCIVCDVVLKSESLWPAHQVSRKHHEAINHMKANAVGPARGNSVKAETTGELSKLKPGHATELCESKPEVLQEMVKACSSSMLPPDFFDNNETKKQKTGRETTKLGNANSYKRPGGASQTQVAEAFNSESKKDTLSNAKLLESKANEIKPAREDAHTQKVVVVSESKHAKGSLPEGFFDDKDADLRARGIKIIKPDVKDEYKEFEKLIHEDLQGVDDRLEEEEIDAAETIEEAETVEQKAYWERVDMLRKKKMELIAARKKNTALTDSRPSTINRAPRAMGKEFNPGESSDDDSDDNFTVDWRAKQM